MSTTIQPPNMLEGNKPPKTNGPGKPIRDIKMGG
ncbi:hypothetical protein PVAG01_10750 [Phlyctema vagabunda]|uniref:Uncharacterized protein n=1 Tax=Phlyctema vagabunda TaxID=108571 RepID=A0ABR4P346_9HELO